MTVRTMTADQLVVSPLNVRTDEDAIKETRGLEASIEAHGLLLPLIAHPMPDGENWGVLAGGRRLRAIQRLVEAGRLPADWSFEVIIRDLTPVEITELSLLENLMRRDLRPWEIHAAVAKAHRQGASVLDIATGLGQTELWVARQLRLGTLAPEILDAYANVEISLEQAIAFAATEDHELQRAAWRWYQNAPANLRNSQHIRSFLKVADRELERLLRFVGDDAYRAAGGRFELDLFADEAEQRGIVVDEGMLRDMAERKLADLKLEIRKQSGRSDLRFAAEAPKAHGHPDTELEISPGWRADREYCLPQGEIIATLSIDDEGDPEPRFWWSSRSAKRAAERLDRAAAKAVPLQERITEVRNDSGFAAADGGQAARAVAKDEEGLSADGLQIVRSVRRELLRAALIADTYNGGSLGRDYVVWSQLRQALGPDSKAKVGARGLATAWSGTDDPEPRDVVASFVNPTKASQLWSRAIEGLGKQDFMTIAQPDEAFEAFVASPDQHKRLAAAVLAGLALIRSANLPGWRVATHDRLASLIGADDKSLRELWEPTPEFVAMFPKMKRLEMAQPHVDAEAFRDWHKLKDPVLTSAVSHVLQNAGWIHPLLSFGVAPEQQMEARESAE